MLILPQIVNVGWSVLNKEYYISQGFHFTKIQDRIDVYILKLPKNAVAKISLICDYCNSEYTTMYTTFVEGRKCIEKDCCRKCVKLKTKDTMMFKFGVDHIMSIPEYRERSGRKRTDPSIVNTAFTDRNYIMIGSYFKAHDKIEYICTKHSVEGIQTISYDALKSGNGCKFCGIEARKGKQRGYTIEEVREVFDSKGCILLSDYYENVDAPLDYICENGHVGQVAFYEFKKDIIFTLISNTDTYH